MLAKLVIGDIDPHRLHDAVSIVQDELIPSFLAHPGSIRGRWMANTRTGHVLVMTTWSDRDSLESARAADGAARAVVAERVGLRLHAIQTMDVLGHTGHETPVDPSGRWVRAIWVEGISADLRPSIRAVYRDIAPGLARAPGFCANYWLVDPGTGNGLALSMWEQFDDLRDGDHDSRRRRRHFERSVGCRVDLVSEYESLAVVARAATRVDSFPVVRGQLVTEMG